MKNLLLNIILLFGLTTFSFAVAAEAGPIKFTNTVKKEIIEENDKGEKVIRYVEPTTAIPGNTMMYNITFENTGDKPVSGIVINDPLPNNSKYVANTATGNNTKITFSVDGENFDVPSKVKIKDASGKVRAASADKYTHIRWVYTKDLLPGEIGKVTFKTKIKKPQEY